MLSASRFTANFLRRARPRRPSRRMHQFVTEVRTRCESLHKLTDSQLKARADKLRERSRPSEKNSAGWKRRCWEFALVNEALRRSTGKTFYDEQILAGCVLTQNAIAEMQTGEGKTLAAALPVASAALRGKNVHVATTNAYLAERDQEQLEETFARLGLTSALLPDQGDPTGKDAAYAAQITYGTGYEFGFDYLRDQLLLRRQSAALRVPGSRWLADIRPEHEFRLTQNSHAVTVIDEADSVLIDEAGTPLIISNGGGNSPETAPFQHAQNLAAELRADTDFEIDAAANRVRLLAEGQTRVNQFAATHAVSDLRRPWSIYVTQALRARHLLRRDADYVVRDAAVCIVDQNTGRIFSERKWRDGLHQAVECFAGVPLTAENSASARISRQRYYQLYDRLCGMTGTAEHGCAELLQIYQLPVVKIPLHRPSRRSQLPTRFFADAAAKSRAIAQATAVRRDAGQPVLVGTRTIAQSLQLSADFAAAGIEHEVLNGIQSAAEADVIAQAGQSGRVTIATNMAGRGTDIPIDQAALSAGGLHVIAAEKHVSRRIDRQLTGRCARQGQPGTCQFFVAADDELVQHHAPRLSKRMPRMANKAGEVQRDLSNEIEQLQAAVELKHRRQRAELARHELWLDRVLDTLAREHTEARYA